MSPVVQKKSDAQIQQEVLRELKWDPRVEETEVGVEVDAGVVTLTGTVSSWGKRIAAKEAAHRVGGVLDVANDIQVKRAGLLTRTDTEIAQAVRHTLQWDVFVPDARIHCTVSDGVVTLEGNVELWSEREDAERAVRNLASVRGVVNKITVAVSPAMQERDVRKAVEEALERRAHREANRIEIAVEDGAVVLSGHVQSWAEKEAVLGAARYTRGVRALQDHLRIEPH